VDAASIFGVTTNQAFLSNLLGWPETRKATFHTRSIDEHIAQLTATSSEADREALALGACFWMIRQRAAAARDPWQSRDLTGWHMATGDAGLSPIPELHLTTAGHSVTIRFAPVQADAAMTIGVNDDHVTVRLDPIGDDRFTAVVGSRREVVRIYQEQSAIFVHDGRGVHAMQALPYLSYISAAAETSGDLRAPMTGMILKVNVAVGDRVKTGDVAAVLESMKMELRIASEVDGVVTMVNCRAGETVERNAVVVVIEPEPSS
jgi:3-methylcrotonyl-CoA carboxylase alpha subunit